MGVKEDVLEALGGWGAKLDDPAMKERFEGFDRTMQIDFTDQDFSILFEFKDQACTVKEGSVDNPDIAITATSEIILGISGGEVSPTRAFMTGKLKAKGPMKDMLKIQMIMK